MPTRHHLQFNTISRMCGLPGDLIWLITKLQGVESQERGLLTILTGYRKLDYRLASVEHRSCLLAMLM